MAAHGVIYRRDVGKRLRALRHDTGMSIEHVSRFLHIPRSTLGKMERGETFPNLRNAALLANFYDVPVDYLAFGKGMTRELKTPLARLRAKG